jgi:hypothetical protein
MVKKWLRGGNLYLLKGWKRLKLSMFEICATNHNPWIPPPNPYLLLSPSPATGICPALPFNIWPRRAKPSQTHKRAELSHESRAYMPALAPPCTGGRNKLHPGLLGNLLN